MVRLRHEPTRERHHLHGAAPCDDGQTRTCSTTGACLGGARCSATTTSTTYSMATALVVQRRQGTHGCSPNA